MAIGTRPLASRALGDATTAPAATQVAHPLSGTVDIVVAVGSPTLRLTHALAGTVELAVSATGNIQAEHPLAGTVAVVANATGELTVSHPLAGSIDIALTAQGRFAAVGGLDARRLVGMVPI